MARKSRQEELIEHLHANGLRKRVAKLIAGAQGGRKRGRTAARDVLGQLETASDTIRTEILGRDKKRSEAAKKAAATRKRNAAKRSTTAKKGAQTRAKKTTRAKAGSSR